MERVTSRKNPRIKHMRALYADRDYRRRCREFVCDGPKLLSEAISSGAQIVNALVLSGREDLYRFPDGVRAQSVPEDVLRSVTDVGSPQGVVFSCRMPDTALEDVPAGDRLILLDGVQDPGNVGTVIRTADAFLISGVILAGPCADPFGPKCVRATMGGVFRQRIYEISREKAASALSGRALYAAENSPRAKDIREIDLSRAVVVIGSEGSGISEEIGKLCESGIRIPMPGKSESLNAAVAASIVLWEMNRQLIARA